MKTVALAAIVVLAGLAAGGGASFATGLLVGTTQGSAPSRKATPPPPPTFVATGKILAPLVFPTGQLAGYVSFEVELQIPADKQDFVRARLPFLLHAINMRTYRTPMASGPDGMLPDLAVFRTVVMAAATEAFGSGIVARAAIVQATPA